MIDTRLRHIVQPYFIRTAKILAGSGITPNQVTGAAFAIGAVSAYLVSRQFMLAALTALWCSGFMDVLDGTLARVKGTMSKSGALLDLILDRMVECAIIIGFYIAAPEHALAYLLFFVGVIFNFSTFLAAGSLFQNRGGKSMHYDPGLLERTETFLLFTVMMVWPAVIYPVLMTFNAALFLTGLLRFVRMFRLEKNHGEGNMS